MPALKWGIVSAGNISHDFVTALRTFFSKDDHWVKAVAARNVESAKKFAALHEIDEFYGSYEKLANDPTIDVIYVGTIHIHHLAVAKMMLEHGKHVLVEKPMTLNAKQTKELIETARKHKRFLMEAIWSRFLPSYRYLMELMEKKTIGDIIHVSATFGKPLLNLDRLTKRSEGGGSLLDLGIYTVNAVSMIYDNEKPKKIAAVGHLNDDGVDISMASSLLYSNNRTAQVTTTTMTSLPCDLVITGTKGIIKIPDTMWCGTTIETPDGKKEFPLPETIVPCNFENSAGLAYEAMEVKKCIQEGKLESSILPLKDSLNLAEMMDEIRRQIGVIYDAD